MDSGRANRVNDGVLILFAVLTIAVVGVLATLHTQAQSARTKTTPGVGPAVPPPPAYSKPQATGRRAGGPSSQGLAAFGQLPRCVKRGVLLAAARDQASLPRARPPCWTRWDDTRGRPMLREIWRAGPGRPWSGDPEAPEVNSEAKSD